jgi:DNA ligase (NAD+)
MTANAKTIKTIPLKAAFSKYGIKRAELRGEAVIRKDIFDKVNDEREKNQQVLFANPRNAATGGLRMKDPNETAKRGIDVFVFQLSYAVDENDNDVMMNLESHSKAINMLKDLGFKVPNNSFGVYDTVTKVAEHCTKWEVERENYPYEIDGMVVKVNAFELQEKAGSTQHHPRWAIAYKFKAKQATSTLEKVEYQVGKTGFVTPVAKITPVALAGVTISSISLHNEEFIQSKDIRLGDTVLVERAGDVIPYIIKSMEDLRSGEEQEIQFPTNCPSCESSLVKAEGEAKWRCVNTLCEAQALQRMIFHVSKEAMNIDGFGKSYVERFHEMGWLRSIADIYRLDYEAIASMEGFGRKSADKLKVNIDLAKRNPIYRLLNSLNVYHLGRKASKIIAEKIDHVLDLQEWTEEDFTSIKDIGPILAKEVITFFSNPVNIEVLKDMESLGVNLRQTEDDKPIEVAADAPFAGKTILFTGSLQQMTRKEAQKKAELAGAKNISAVSSKLDFLVVGEKAGSKLKKAEALGTVSVLTEEDFLAMVD